MSKFQRSPIITRSVSKLNRGQYENNCDSKDSPLDNLSEIVTVMTATTMSGPTLITSALKIEQFSGANGQDPDNWLSDLNDAFDGGDIKEDRRRKLLPSYLCGNAKAWYRQNQEDLADRNWSEIQQELIKQFTTALAKPTAFSELVNRRQGLEETVDTYYYSVLTLCAKFNPKMSVEDKLMHLQRGLRPSSNRQ
ncbi:unnamed protein product [Didymodactylos carnosus]|uniref:Retrotransposon gag domain-containing protein n=1 Tax=Didymodactylos carnosus TaxID=1234261 RepID=A0A8S2YDF9_9BILA|nr:unnamed protein product [Didymodactylos carnosus]